MTSATARGDVHFKALVQQHGSSVRRAARRVAQRCPPNVQLDDLVQAGLIGLWMASRNYDEDKKPEELTSEDGFSAYAMRRIRGAMLDELRSTDPMSRLQRSRVRKLQERMQSYTGDAEDQTAPAQALCKAADELGLDQDEAGRLLAVSRTDSLDDHMGVDGEYESMGTVGDEVEIRADASLWAQRVDELMDSMPERERLVFNAWLHEDTPSEDLAARFGVTESRISQMKKKVLAELPELAQKLISKRATVKIKPAGTPAPVILCTAPQAPVSPQPWHSLVLEMPQGLDATVPPGVASQDIVVAPPVLWG